MHFAVVFQHKIPGGITMAFLADGVYVGRTRYVDAPIQNENLESNKYYDVKTGRGQHEARRSEMQDIRNKLKDIEDNASNYLYLLNRYQELDRQEKTEYDVIKKAIDDGPGADMLPADRKKYTDELTSLH